MEDQKNQLELLFEKATDYVETRLDLFKLKATQKSTDVISSLASRLILILIVTLIVFMVNIGLALLLGEVLGKSYYGFLFSNSRMAYSSSCTLLIFITWLIF